MTKVVKVNRTTLYLKPIYGEPVVGTTLSQNFATVNHLKPLFYYRDYLYEKIFNQCQVIDNTLYLKYEISKIDHIDPNFLMFLRYIRKHKLYYDDYPMDLRKIHVVMLKIPNGFEKSWLEFGNSNYSKMYSKDQIKELKIQEKEGGEISTKWAVLTKNPRGREKAYQFWKNQLNIHFPNIPASYIPPIEEVREFDIAINLVLKQEILNFNQSNQSNQVN